jgi:NAD(P)-dependent dehydrogenase (short-subunit alcohol dehydrogenase family)
MARRFEGKVVLVTGGGSGMGEATARRMAEEGATVSVIDLDAGGGERVVEAIGLAGGAASFTQADISTADGARLAVSTTVERHGGLDVLVNNAGVATAQVEDSWDTDEAEWDRVLGVNLKGVYLCTKFAVPELLKRGGGAIVVTASIASQVACAAAAYTASKGGVALYTKTIAVELARQNIRVNAVGPGYIVTPMTTGEREGLSPVDQKERLDAMAANIPAGRCGDPVEVANAILFLASDEASYITGQLLCVDGGYTAV